MENPDWISVYAYCIRYNFDRLLPTLANQFLESDFIWNEYNARNPYHQWIDRLYNWANLGKMALDSRINIILNHLVDQKRGVEY